MYIRNFDHIALYFVSKEYMNKGIGKLLFNKYLNEIKSKDIKKITVKSSFYGEKIYGKLGFVKTMENIQEKNGMKYIPMEYTI